MQAIEYDSTAERAIVTALIVSKEVLTKIEPRWYKEPFHSKWSNEIGQWCIDFFKKHKSAPKATIVTLFAEWCRKNKDDDTKKAMERFLSQLSRKYEALNEEIQASHVIEMAAEHFNAVRLEKVYEDVQARIARGDTTGAIEVASGFVPIKFTSPAFIDPFRDKAAQAEALDFQAKVLIRYKGGIGEFYGDELAEDSFVAFIAPMKVGKSYSIMDVAWEAVKQGKKVAYFQVGDMTKNQLLRRFHKRAARRPIKARAVRWPISLVPAADGGVAQVEHDIRIFEENMTTEEIHAAYEAIVSKHKTQRMRISHHPSKTICVNDIKAILDEWDRDGWKAKVVAVDYVENLLPNNPKMTELNQVEDTWTHLRQISEIRQCCVITAAQTNKEGFSPWILTKNNFSRNKMILAVVTGMVGINQTEAEKQLDSYRLNWIVRREDIWSPSKCCHVAACLDIGQAVVLSSF